MSIVFDYHVVNNLNFRLFIVFLFRKSSAFSSSLILLLYCVKEIDG